MPAARRTRTSLTCSRAVVAWVLLVAHAVSAVGFPVARAGRAVAGACAGGACGCSPASAGGPDCCCAKPPAQKSLARQLAVRAAPRGCCLNRPVCDTAAPAGCCPKTGDAAAATGPEPPAAAVTWVLGWKARQCKGHGPLGLPTADPAVPADLPAVGPLPVGFVGYVPVAMSFPVARPLVPPDPPPKSC